MVVSLSQSEKIMCAWPALIMHDGFMFMYKGGVACKRELACE